VHKCEFVFVYMPYVLNSPKFCQQSSSRNPLPKSGMNADGMFGTVKSQESNKNKSGGRMMITVSS
jgi:hypothetical protein